MPKLNPSNRLYLYQLFSREIGFNRQTRADVFEDVLAADGLTLHDLGADDVTQLAQELEDFCRLTVFKGGRVFVTLVANDEFDRALQKSAGPKKDAKQGKSFKRPKTAKSARPVKPRHIEEPKAEPEAAETPEQEAQAETHELEAREARPAPEAPEATEGSATPEVAHAEPDSAEAGETEKVVLAEAAAGSVADGIAPEPAAKNGQTADAQAGTQAAAPEAKPASGPEPGPAKAAPEPLHHISLNITYNPYDGLEDEVIEHVEPDEPAYKAPTAFAPTAAPTSPAVEKDEKGHRCERPASATTDSEQPARHPASESASSPAARQQPEAAPAAASVSPVSTTSTHEPRPSHAAQTPNAQAHPATAATKTAPAPASTPAPASVPATSSPQPQKPSKPLTPDHDAAGRTRITLRDSHPRRLSDAVHVSNEMLEKLYAALPLDAQPLEELDRSWRRARSTGLLFGTSGQVSFSLSYLAADGSAPATATIKHVRPLSSGKRWELADLQLGGDAGTAGEPKPLVPLGADTALLDRLCSLVFLGSWDKAAEQLGHATQAAGLPGVPAAQLRTYLPTLVSAAVQQGLLEVSADGRRASFALGSPDDVLYALLDQRPKDDIEWTLSGFAAPGDKRLDKLEKLPKLPVTDPTLRLF